MTECLGFFSMDSIEPNKLMLSLYSTRFVLVRKLADRLFFWKREKTRISYKGPKLQGIFGNVEDYCF